MAQEKIVFETSDLDVFTLLENRRLEAQRQNETLHGRISDLRDELRSEISASHKEIMKEIKELREEQRSQHKEMSEKVSMIEKELRDEQEEQTDDLSKRISLLERWKWFIVGAGTVLGFLISNGLDAVKNFLK
jgi:gas vesicle protein